jgi:hypothetical protein
MADKTYQGNDGNWATAVTWVPANEPVDGDVVIIPSDTTVNITAGLDNGGVKLGGLIVAKGSVVKVGTTGNPLKIASAFVHFQGREEFNYEHAANAGDAEVTDLVIIEPSLPTAAVQLSSEETDALGMPDVLLNGGNVNILANMGTMTRLDVTARTDRLVIQPDAGVLTSLFGRGSRIEAHNVITNAYLSNGCQLTKETAAITNAFIEGGASLFYNDDGTITLVRVHKGGTLDLMRVGKFVTITTGIWMPGSTVNLDPTAHTVTNLYDLRGT